MVWVCVVILNLLIGICIGAIVMYYRDRHLLNNHKMLHNELQNSKNKLNEYEKKISNHFTYNIELLNRIAENYQRLYQNMTKSASFFLPNIHTQDNVYTFHIKNTHKKNEEQLPIEVPRDYSDDTEILQNKNHDTK